MIIFQLVKFSIGTRYRITKYFQLYFYMQHYIIIDVKRTKFISKYRIYTSPSPPVVAHFTTMWWMWAA